MSGKRGRHKRLHLGIILEAEEADNERSSLIFSVLCHWWRALLWGQTPDKNLHFSEFLSQIGGWVLATQQSFWSHGTFCLI